ncbi:hypothetical protein N0V87_003800 [Didymella glomerata]|jgi:hypothetical protein|uniref:Heterokaryon incompatibility domain-containing protein n=1 Tax=Didymella glomerata TaxID=749621 RepID=A0A9W9C2F9_9PLEO|nr:hypothetical protein N0V87_003800 [Didymella glomerata]
MSNDTQHELQVPRPRAIYERVGDELFKLTLTEQNKAEIFAYGLSKLDGSQQEAGSVLENLAKWDPNIRSQFVLRSYSTVLDTPFRLIYTNADLPFCEETNLYVRQYMAISYCWRSEDFLPHGYERYGEWPVSRPFVEAILSEKLHQRVGIWMDQLCIDQTSNIDKQKSVAAMDVIYRSCLSLIVLLEDVFLNESEVALAEDNAYDTGAGTYDRAWIPPAADVPVLESLCGKVCAARWWQRAWCFHEFSVNEPWNDERQSDIRRNATFIVNGPGKSVIKIKWRILHSILVYSEFARSPFTGQDLLIPIDFGDREPGWRSSLMARHNAVISKGCLLVEDKISIMINTSGMGLAYQGALRTHDDVLYAGALLSLAAGERHPLSMMNGRLLPTLNGNSTWLQQNLIADDVTIPRFRPGSLNGIHRISMQDIELDVVFLQPPARWTGGLVQDISCTFQVFPETIVTSAITTVRQADHAHPSLGHEDKELDASRRRFLASCISNGHVFTARLWNQLMEEVVKPNYNQGHNVDLAPNPDLLAAARRFIQAMLPVSALLGISPPPEFTLSDAHLFLTWLTDPRSKLYIGLYTFRITCTTDGQEAFTTGAEINAHFKDGPYEELQAVIPTDLLQETCIPLRIWLLRPKKLEDGTEIWRLAGKTRMLGEPDLSKEAEMSAGRDDAVVKSRRVVVGG